MVLGAMGEYDDRTQVELEVRVHTCYACEHYCYCHCMVQIKSAYFSIEIL